MAVKKTRFQESWLAIAYQDVNQFPPIHTLFLISVKTGIQLNFVNQGIASHT